MAADPSTLKSHLSPSRSTSVNSSNSVSKSANPSVVDTKTEGPPPSTAETTEKHADAINEKELEATGIASRTAAATEVAKEEDSAAIVEDDETVYPKGWKLGLITMALCLSVFCMALDNTIIATAIPKITDKFHALDDVGWYASSYLLTTCAFQLIFGKLYSFYSIKWTYLTAILIFEIGSLVCGLAPNSLSLIIGRAVAGLGSAGIFSGAILIVAHTVPLRQRPTYTGLIGGMYGLASVAGPLMGGAFTDNPHLTWRWCFYINLPFGFVTILFIIAFFTSPPRKAAAKLSIKEQLAQMDLLGTSAFLPGVVCLLLALQWGGTKYPWGNGRIIALLVLGGLLLIGFVGIQIWRGERATVPPRVFKNRNIWGCALFSACLGGAFFVMMFYLPIWFQAIKGVSAIKSGIMSLPLILGLVVVSMLAGAAVSVFGYYTPFMYLSIVCMAIGAGLLTTLKLNSGHAVWIGYQVLFGAGIGFGMQQTLIAAQTCMPMKDVPIATAIMMFCQTFGGALIVSVGQNIFTNQLAKNLIKEVPNFDTRIILAVGATQLKSQVPANLYQAVLVAYNTALTQTYYVSVALSCLAILGVVSIEWLSVKGKKIDVVAA